MSRPRLPLHVLPALVVALLSLAVPVIASDDAAHGTAVQHAGSVEARAASTDPVADPAQTFAVGGTDLQAARAIAQQYWGRDACAGQVEFAWAVLDPGTNATASWRNPTDAWNNPDENFDCRIEFNAQADYDWAKFCTVVAHEVGHLNGQPHATEAGLLMSAYYSAPIAQCEAAQPAAPAPAPAPAPAVAQPASSSAPRAAQPAARPAKVQKRTLRRAAKRRAAKRRAAKRRAARRAAKRRCVVRFKAGKRARRCAAGRRKGARKRTLVARVVSVRTTS